MTQIMRPSSDINTDWSRYPSSGGRYDKIDEATYDDADYIYGTATTYEECGLSAPAETPGAGEGTVRFRVKGTGSTNTITVSIRYGSTIIKTASAITLGSGYASYAEYTVTLSEAEMATLAGYGWNDVRVRFLAGGAQASLYVSWAQFEVPDAPAVQAGLEMGVMF